MGRVNSGRNRREASSSIVVMGTSKNVQWLNRAPELVLLPLAVNTCGTSEIRRLVKTLFKQSTYIFEAEND